MSISVYISVCAVGNVSGDVNHEHKTLTLGQVQSWHTDLGPGGEWSPPGCVARYRLAVVIPYRDRLAHLTVLLAHLLPILKRQQLHFKIFVVEQVSGLVAVLAEVVWGLGVGWVWDGGLGVGVGWGLSLIHI